MIRNVNRFVLIPAKKNTQNIYVVGGEGERERERERGRERGEREGCLLYTSPSPRDGV